MDINLEMVPVLLLSFGHHLDICVFHVEILESHSEMEILKREGNFDQILKREKNQIKMRDAPFQLKISKEDSLIDCGVLCSISGKKSINSMFYVRKTRETELLTTLAPDVGTLSHKELLLE